VHQLDGVARNIRYELENTVKNEKLEFKLKLVGFRGVREERTDHTKLCLRGFTGYGDT